MSEGSSENVDIDLSDNPGKVNVSTKDEGQTYTYSRGSTTITIKVSEVVAEIAIYKRLTYNLPGKSTIKSIKNNSNDTNISIVNKSTFHVYYWIGDTNFTTPLIAQVDGNCYEYDRDKWKKDDLASRNLEKGLDGQNCKRNKAHQIEVSIKNGEHFCSSNGCTGMKFTIASDETNKTTYKYIRYTFTPQNPGKFRLFYFTHKRTPQTGFSYPENVKSVNIYWKSGTGVSFPSLIHYMVGPKNIWYKAKDNKRIWEQISEFGIENVSENSSANIKRLIDGKYLPIITIDVSHVPIPQSTYIDNSSKETLDVSKDGDDLNEYDQFVHNPEDNVYFKLGEVKHKSTTLKGIETKGILSSITAYYWNGDKGLKTPLLIELVTGENISKYTYYSKKTKSTNEWTQLPEPGGVNGKFEEGQLKPILDEPKKVHFTSNTTIVGGTVGGVLGGGGAVGLVVWKGPALLARLITRL
ncbi:hypothetical protein BEWA_024450 [Theileria equi strain WA]|uniref:Uncharacterized protein n=1 Tax=Theileria equi strain WA TaxID=1537102 RepID=L0AX44_THEEQ|nr:hypothetical protein BEWA_024450 [Theileria equi strain WA]AFZ79596.1 hypothetical protein BEWA_024450 [Theileria equi strain WA]|eukprot:XP_004829262.1 hypothetical protein BEWA_024450 [Theileria equi strain WA]